jgi:hypothetical protein
MQRAQGPSGPTPKAEGADEMASQRERPGADGAVSGNH